MRKNVYATVILSFLICGLYFAIEKQKIYQDYKYKVLKLEKEHLESFQKIKWLLIQYLTKNEKLKIENSELKSKIRYLKGRLKRERRRIKFKRAEK